jgi:hypothetical protein
MLVVGSPVKGLEWIPADPSKDVEALVVALA